MDIERYEPGPALDALVHERVMGLKPPAPEEYPKAPAGGRAIWVPPAYSTDLATAWQVVLKRFPGEPMTILTPGHNPCRVVFGQPGREVQASGRTVELAICRAALKTVSR